MTASHRLPARGLAWALLVPLALGLAGCSCCDDDPYYDYGFLYLWNRSDTTTNEMVTEFYIAPDGVAYGGSVLPMPLAPGDEDYLGEWYNDIYDATAVFELGGWSDFFDFFIGDGQDTVLEAF